MKFLQVHFMVMLLYMLYYFSYIYLFFFTFLFDYVSCARNTQRLCLLDRNSQRLCFFQLFFYTSIHTVPYLKLVGKYKGRETRCS